MRINSSENGLGVVLSVIPELQPHWIHRVIPDSHLVNCHGHKVQSGNRHECHFGLTPGGCFDHPEVWSRMAAFMARVVEQYKGAPHLRGWDIWNELRWNVQADELVCYCPHTMNEFRAWLKEKHLDEIEGLKLLFLPRVAVVDQQLASRLEAFVRAGGTLVCEPETGAYDSRGIFRYLEERFPVRLIGRVEVGRRSLDGVSTDVKFNGRNYSLPSAQWLEPIGRKAGEKDGERLVVTAVGNGQVIQLACYSADPYIASDLCGSPEWKGCCGGFEQLVLALTRHAGVVPTVEVRSENYVYIKSGTIGGQRAAFVIHAAPEPVRLRFSGDAARAFNDLISGHARTPGADGWLDLECEPLLGVGLLVEQYAEKQ